MKEGRASTEFGANHRCLGVTLAALLVATDLVTLPLSQLSGQAVLDDRITITARAAQAILDQGTQERRPARLRELSLEEAIAAALAGNPRLDVARAAEQTARADLRMATSSLLPRLDVVAGYTRSIDPVVAFGTKLRQGRFAQPDFGLAELNNPAPIQDFGTETRLTWSAVDPMAWAGHRASARRAQAAAWQQVHSRQTTIFATKALYFSAVATEARLEAAGAAVESAQATYELFRKRRTEGLLTRADVL